MLAPYIFRAKTSLVYHRHMCSLYYFCKRVWLQKCCMGYFCLWRWTTVFMLWSNPPIRADGYLLETRREMSKTLKRWKMVWEWGGQCVTPHPHGTLCVCVSPQSQPCESVLRSVTQLCMSVTSWKTSLKLALVPFNNKSASCHTQHRVACERVSLWRTLHQPQVSIYCSVRLPYKLWQLLVENPFFVVSPSQCVTENQAERQ